MKYIRKFIAIAYMLCQSWRKDKAYTNESKAEYIVRTTLLNPNKSKR